jgi:hypothetical protein
LGGACVTLKMLNTVYFFKLCVKKGFISLVDSVRSISWLDTAIMTCMHVVLRAVNNGGWVMTVYGVVFPMLRRGHRAEYLFEETPFTVKFARYVIEKERAYMKELKGTYPYSEFFKEPLWVRVLLVLIFLVVVSVIIRYFVKKLLRAVYAPGEVSYGRFQVQFMVETTWAIIVTTVTTLTWPFLALWDFEILQA